MFAVALQLFSELTAKEATAGTPTLFKIPAETIKQEGYVADLSVSNASLLINSFASNCVAWEHLYVIPDRCHCFLHKMFERRERQTCKTQVFSRQHGPLQLACIYTTKKSGAVLCRVSHHGTT